MDKGQVNIFDLLEYLQEMIDGSTKLPMSGKVVVDKKEFLDTVNQIINYLPEQLKRAEWVMQEQDKILAEANRQKTEAREETKQLLKEKVENADVVKEAKMRAHEIISSAKKEAKTIRIGSREYSDEILSDLDKELEKKKVELIKSLQTSFEIAARDINDNLNGACSTIKENIKELRTMK